MNSLGQVIKHAQRVVSRLYISAKRKCVTVNWVRLINLEWVGSSDDEVVVHFNLYTSYFVTPGYYHGTGGIFLVVFVIRYVILPVLFAVIGY